VFVGFDYIAKPANLPALAPFALIVAAGIQAPALKLHRTRCTENAAGGAFLRHFLPDR
jgi:hypothetical protein